MIRFLPAQARIPCRFRILFCAALLFFVIPAARAGAHPHIWVHYSVEVRFTEQGLAGFAQRWKFDEMFTNELMYMYDLCPESPLTEEDVKTLRANAFQNLGEYYYLTHVVIDGKPFYVQWVKDFNARFEGRNMVYEFFVPCTVSAIESPKTIQFLVFDEEFFVDARMAGASPVTIKAPPEIEWKKTVGPDDDFRFLGFLKPAVLTFQFRKP